MKFAIRFKPRSRLSSPYSVLASETDSFSSLSTDEDSQADVEDETTEPPSEQCRGPGQQDCSSVEEKILHFEGMKRRQSEPSIQSLPKRIKLDDLAESRSSGASDLPNENGVSKGNDAATSRCPSGNVLLATEKLESKINLARGIASSATKKKRVRWSTVDVRFYDTKLIVTPAGGMGPKIGISEHFKKHSLSVDHYEKIRPVDERRSMLDLYIDDHQRYEMLVAKGYTSSQIFDSICEAYVVQKQRQDTIYMLRWMPVEAFLERMVAFGKVPFRRRLQKD